MNLLALQTSFVAPVGPGAVEVTVSVLRQGKNVCQVLAHVRRREQAAAVLLGSYGAARASVLTPRRPAPQALLQSFEAMPAVFA